MGKGRIGGHPSASFGPRRPASPRVAGRSPRRPPRLLRNSGRPPPGHSRGVAGARGIAVGTARRRFSLAACWQAEASRRALRGWTESWARTPRGRPSPRILARLRLLRLRRLELLAAPRCAWPRHATPRPPPRPERQRRRWTLADHRAGRGLGLAGLPAVVSPPARPARRFDHCDRPLPCLALGALGTASRTRCAGPWARLGLALASPYKVE